MLSPFIPTEGIAPEHLALLAFLLAAIALISAVIVRLMIRAGVMDVPGHRSSHNRPTPKGGGIGIMAAFLAGMPLITLLLHQALVDRATYCLLAGMILLAAFSWWDDIHSLPPLAKLVAQFAAAATVLTGVSFPGSALLQILLYAGALCWLIYVTNAVNFMDGINGLAAGSMALVCFGVAMDAAHVERDALIVTPMVLAASLIGFLPFNYPRARIFMGDVGSQSAGLAVAWFGVQGLEFSSTNHGTTLEELNLILVPSMLSAILFDVTFTLLRRAHLGQKLTEAHRGHLYQLAVRSGIPAPAVTFIYWMFAIWGGLVAVRAHTITVVALAIVIPLIVWTLIVIRRGRHTVSRPW